MNSNSKPILIIVFLFSTVQHLFSICLGFFRCPVSNSRYLKDLYKNSYFKLNPQKCVRANGDFFLFSVCMELFLLLVHT